MADKIFAKGIYIKEIPTQYGGILKVGINIEKFAQFVKEHKKDGYINLSVMKLKEPGKYGETHYAVLDTYEKKEAPKEPPVPKDPDLPF